MRVLSVITFRFISCAHLAFSVNMISYRFFRESLTRSKYLKPQPNLVNIFLEIS